MKKNKLWFKFLISFLLVASIFVSTFVFAYSVNFNSKNIEGYELKSNYSERTNIDLTKLHANVVKNNGDVVTDVVAKVDLEKKQVNGLDIDVYFKNQAQKGILHDLVIYVGGTVFQNSYLAAVPPKIWIDFVLWFLNNVSYGPEINALRNFKIIKGVEAKGSRITLGGFKGTNNEDMTITIYPDAYFGTLPFYNNYSGKFNHSSILLDKFGLPGTFAEIKTLIEDVMPKLNLSLRKNYRDIVTRIKEVLKDSKLKLPKLLEPYLVPGDFRYHFANIEEVDQKFINNKLVSIYQIYMPLFPKLLQEVRKRYPFYLKERIGPIVEYDAKTNRYHVLNKKHKFFPLKSRISMIDIIRLHPDFTNFGISWLKATAAHEYYHHQTKYFFNNSAASKKLRLMGAWDFTINKSRMFHQNFINNYLAARAPELEIYGVDQNNNPNEHGVFNRFSVNNQKETNRDIFGGDLANVFKNNPNNKRSFKSFNQLKRNYNNKPYLGYLLNAFDNYSGTLSPSLRLNKRYVQAKNGHFISHDTYKFDRENLTEVEKTFFKASSLSPYIQINSPGASLTKSPYDEPSRRVNGWRRSERRSALIAALKNKVYLNHSFKNFFSNYIFTPEEVLVRDYLIITYQDKQDFLLEGFKTLTSANTGYGLYVPSFYYQKWLQHFIRLLSFVSYSKYENGLDNLFRAAARGTRHSNFFAFLGKSKNLYANAEIFQNETNPNSLRSIFRKLKNSPIKKDQFTYKALLKITMLVPETNFRVFNFNAFRAQIRNSYLTQNLLMESQFSRMYSIHKTLNWQIYNTDGTQASYQNPSYKKPLLSIDGTKITGIADAYWNFILRMHSVGNGTISGIYRSLFLDKMYFWGFAKTNLLNQVKYLAFVDSSTKKINYLPIQINQDNLFYYTNYAYKTRKILRDHDYSSWSTKFVIIGKYANAFLKPGEYQVYFVNQQKHKIKGLSLGNRQLLTENSKTKVAAATFMSTTNKNDQLKFVVKPHF